METKFCIIGTSNLKHISLISLYTSFFDRMGIPYDIIYWDRYGINEHSNARRVYKYVDIGRSSSISRALSFWRFRKFIIQKFREEKYTFLITWQTTCAYVLCDYLLSKFRGRYIVNVRDYVKEKCFPFSFLIKQLVRNAAFVTISSEGFLSFLPPANYIKVNSLNEELLDSIQSIPQSHNHVIKIGFAGNCRYLKESFQLIESLGNDSRFEIWYCGTNSEKLAEYAKIKGIRNLFTKPAFDPVETVPIMSEFNIINSAFGNDAMDNRTLMPIRLYTALAVRRPLLVNSDTFLGYEVEKNQLGFVIHRYDSLADDLYSYYQALDFSSFDSVCNDYLARARDENEAFYAILKRLID